MKKEDLVIGKKYKSNNINYYGYYLGEDEDYGSVFQVESEKFGVSGLKCEFPNLNKIIDSDYYLRHSIIHEEFREINESEFILPEKWYCPYSNKEEFNIMNEFFNAGWGYIEPDGIRGCCNLKDNNNWNLNSYGEKITFDQFKKYVLKEEFPEKWALKCNNEKEAAIFLDWIESGLKNNWYNLRELQENYFHYPNYKNYNGFYLGDHTSSEVKFGYKEITFEQWENHYKEELVKINEPVFEVGKWWKSKIHPEILIYIESKNRRYGFTNLGNWFEDNTKHSIDNNNYEATENEVSKILLDYANKNYPVGTVYEDPLCNSIEIVDNVFCYYDKSKQVTDDCGGSVFYKGKWANVIKYGNKLQEQLYPMTSSNSFEPNKLESKNNKLILTIDDEELPMVIVKKSKTITNFLNN